MNILYVRSNFPKHSETFIVQEILSLRKMGHNVQVLAYFCETHKIHPVVLDEDVFSFVKYDTVPFSIPKDQRREFQRLAPSRKYWSFKNLFRIHKLKSRERKSEKNIFNAVWTVARNPLAILKLARNINNFHIALEYYIGKNNPLEKPDIIYCPFSTLQNLRYAEALSKHYGGVPFVTCFRASDLYSMYKVEPAERIEFLKQAAAVVTISMDNVNVIKNKYPFVRDVHIVHSSIDTNFFTKTSNPTNTEKTKPLILSVGRLIEKKGYLVLLRACEVLKNKNFDFQCIIVGEGILETHLKQEIQRLGLDNHVQLSGPQNREIIKSYLTVASVFTLPCIVASDGNRDVLANVLKEAMSMELPVVTSDLPGIEELVRHNYNGLIVQQGCHISLANALEKLVSTPLLAKEMGKRGRLDILSGFCSQTEPVKLLNIFTTVIGNSKKN